MSYRSVGPNAWTTQDELAFLAMLYIKGNLHALQGYLVAAINRSWHSAGVDMDPQACIGRAQEYIESIKLGTKLTDAIERGVILPETSNIPQ